MRQDRIAYALSTLLVCGAIAVARCVPPPPTPPVPPVADAAPADVLECGTPATCMCAKLESLGCEEGKHDACVETIEHVIAARLTFIDEACIMRSTSKGEVRACAGVRCP